MYTNIKQTELEHDSMDKKLANIDKTLVHYYGTLIKEFSGNEFHYKNEIMNALISFYYTNKTKFSNPPLLLKDHFLASDKLLLTLNLNAINFQLFCFSSAANNRPKKLEAEWIITNILLTFKNKGVDEIIYDDNKLVLYRKNKIVSL